MRVKLIGVSSEPRKWEKGTLSEWRDIGGCIETRSEDFLNCRLIPPVWGDSDWTTRSRLLGWLHQSILFCNEAAEFWRVL